MLKLNQIFFSCIVRNLCQTICGKRSSCVRKTLISKEHGRLWRAAVSELICIIFNMCGVEKISNIFGSQMVVLRNNWNSFFFIHFSTQKWKEVHVQMRLWKPQTNMIFIPMMWVHAQTSQLYCVSRGYFSPPQHPAASQSYEQCTRIWLSPSSLQIPRGSPAAWCLLQVIIRALALTSTLADRGSPPPQRTECDCFNVAPLVFGAPAETPTTYQPTAMCRLENYKNTNCQSWV